jgi:hypothetical protein
MQQVVLFEVMAMFRVVDGRPVSAVEELYSFSAAPGRQARWGDDTGAKWVEFSERGWTRASDERR